MWASKSVSKIFSNTEFVVKFVKRFFLSSCFLLLGVNIHSQGYSVVERTDLRRYDNGKYIGLTSREVRSFISVSSAPNERLEKSKQFQEGSWYDGYFYVMEETNRNMRQAAAGIHGSIDSTFHLTTLGQMTMFLDNGFPTFRSFPTFPEKDIEKLKVGDCWQGTAERAVDPLNKGKPTRMPITVLYENCGLEDYKGEKVLRLKAKWGTNYGISSRDPRGDSTLEKGTGSHNADILVRLDTKDVILIIDRIDETFIYSDGRQINFKGTLNHFTEYPPAIKKEKLFPALNRLVAKSEDLGGKGSSIVASAKSAENPVPATKTVSKPETKPEIKPVPVAKPMPAPKPVSKPEQKPSFEKISDEMAKLPPVPEPVSTKKFAYEETEKGIRISIRDLKFKPDSAELLESERQRLSEIAEVLKMAEGSHFLVEGHTAAVGRPEGEMTLSEQRAVNISKELEELGVKAGSFITKGYGGNKPIASNQTSEGRALNRRVEITILK